MKRNRSIIISYRTMRQCIGWLGISLPLVLVGGGWLAHPGQIEGNISSYYYTHMRDMLVGVLAAVGLFLITYKGYDTQDNVITNLSGLAAFGIALFPTEYSGNPSVGVGIFSLSIVRNHNSSLHPWDRDLSGLFTVNLPSIPSPLS